MDLKWGISFLVVFFSWTCVDPQETTVSLDLPKAASTWSGTMSSNSCAIFSGDILKNINNARASVHATEVNQKGWVGAYTYFTNWILITGCKLVKSSDIESASTSIHEGGQQNNVLFCERKCQNQSGSVRLFALSEFHCFCLSRIPVSSGSCIPTYCPGDLNDFCGSKGSNYPSGLVTDVMVYTKDETIPTNTSGAEECLTVKYTNDVLLSSYNKVMRVFQNPDGASCSTENGFICKQVGAVIVDLSRKHYNHPRRTWTDAARECYRQYGYQISSDVNSVVQNNSALMTSEKAWIGSFRKHYDFTTTTSSDFKDVSSSESNIHCMAAIVDVSGKITLTYQNCDERLPVWCVDSMSSVTQSHAVTTVSTTLPAITSVSTSISTNSTLISTPSTQKPYNPVTDNLIAVTTNELDINITITVLASLFTIGIFIIVAVLLRRVYMKENGNNGRKSTRQTSSSSDSSNENRNISRVNLNPKLQPGGINNTESIYSVIIENDTEAPRYSEVIYNDMWRNNAIKAPNVYANAQKSAETTQASSLPRKSGYLEMRPRRYIYMSARRKQKRDSQSYVAMRRDEDRHSNYVKMSLEDPSMRKSQGYVEMTLGELSEKNELVFVEMTPEELSKRKEQGYMVMSLEEISKIREMDGKLQDTLTNQRKEDNLPVSLKEMSKRKSDDYVDISEIEGSPQTKSCGVSELSIKRENNDNVVDYKVHRRSEPARSILKQQSTSPNFVRSEISNMQQMDHKIMSSEMMKKRESQDYAKIQTVGLSSNESLNFLETNSNIPSIVENTIYI